MGVNPRELSEFDGAAELPQLNDDPLEWSIRQRLIANNCILKALVELRCAVANKTRPHQIDEASVVPGSAIEIWMARPCQTVTDQQRPRQCHRGVARQAV